MAECIKDPKGKGIYEKQILKLISSKSTMNAA